MADGSTHLSFTADVEVATASLWEKVRGHVTPLEWRLQAPLIEEINRLKRAKNAVILAHNYMTPEIFHGVGDFVGDSLGLAREAARSDADVIVQACAPTRPSSSPTSARAVRWPHRSRAPTYASSSNATPACRW